MLLHSHITHKECGQEGDEEVPEEEEEGVRERLVGEKWLLSGSLQEKVHTSPAGRNSNRSLFTCGGGGELSFRSVPPHALSDSHRNPNMPPRSTYSCHVFTNVLFHLILASNWTTALHDVHVAFHNATWGNHEIRSRTDSSLENIMHSCVCRFICKCYMYNILHKPRINHTDMFRNSPHLRNSEHGHLESCVDLCLVAVQSQVMTSWVQARHTLFHYGTLFCTQVYFVCYKEPSNNHTDA